MLASRPGHSGLEEGLLVRETYNSSCLQRSATTEGLRCPVSEPEADAEGEQEKLLLERRTVHNPRWTIDRGAGYYANERVKRRLPSLIQTGRLISFRRQQPIVLHPLRAAAAVPHQPDLLVTCVLHHLVFAIDTQMTIGYGTRSPGDCWLTAVSVAAHSLLTVVVDSLIIGIALARVVQPEVHAYLYTWGLHREGHTTSEGEHIPVRVQALGAEIVIVFRGTTELGDNFHVRQSYLPQ
ncbi:E set domain-containing protein, partial [Haematococcus lacustris]